MIVPLSVSRINHSGACGGGLAHLRTLNLVECFLIFVVLSLSGCAQWINNYESSASVTEKFNIDPEKHADIRSSIKAHAKIEGFRTYDWYVRDHDDQAMSVYFRKREVLIWATNLGETSALKLFLYRAKQSELRLTDDELESIASGFARAALDQ